MYSGWNFLIWKSSWILTCSFITAVLMLCKDHIWVLLYFKYALHCMQLHTTLHDSTIQFFSPAVPAYTPDLNFTEGFCIDPTDFKYKSKSCRGVMLMQADLCRRWYMANMFSFFFTLKEAPAAAKGHCSSFQIRNIHSLCLQKTFFFLSCKSLLKSLAEIKNKHKNDISG